jgi:RES domain
VARPERFERTGTHRLIPAKFSGKSVLDELALPAHVVADLGELDAATNERKTAERGGNAAIGPGELLYGVPEAHIVNAAFTHPGPWGGRFNDARRGAWYAAVELETAVREVGYHRRRFLSDGRIGGRVTAEYQDFLADFAADFYFLDEAERKTCAWWRNRFRSAMGLHRRWPWGFCMRGRTGLFTRAYAMRAGRAWRASGRRWCIIRGAGGGTGSAWRRGKMRSRLRR